MIDFDDYKIPARNDLIEAVELLFDVSFPIDYKEHILKFNGGSCKPSRFNFFENGEKSSSSIRFFYAFYIGQYSSIFESINIYKIDERRMPYQIFPIAYDSLGNLICISLAKIDYGHIYFWDHENEVDYSNADDNDYSNLYLIANGFTEFLEALF